MKKLLLETTFQDAYNQVGPLLKLYLQNKLKGIDDLKVEKKLNKLIKIIKKKDPELARMIEIETFSWVSDPSYIKSKLKY